MKSALKCSPANTLVAKIIKHFFTVKPTLTDSKLQIMTVQKITVRLGGSTERVNCVVE